MILIVPSVSHTHASKKTMASSADEDYEYDYSDDDAYPVLDSDDEDAMEVENPNAAPMAWTKTSIGKLHCRC